MSTAASVAAEQAEERFAFQEAAQIWEQAIACMDRGREIDARERIELVLSLVRALAQSGQLIRARGYRQEAVRSASLLSDPLLLARVITAYDTPGLWRITEYGTFDDELVQTAERALELLPAGEDHLRCRLPAGLPGLRAGRSRNRPRLPGVNQRRGTGLGRSAIRSS